VRIDADHNTSLSGLYRSKDGYFTQCEAQGFRRITWFPDRPDIMSRYQVTLHADKARLPVLLANGNPVGSGDEGTTATGRAGKIPLQALLSVRAGCRPPRRAARRVHHRQRSQRQLAVFVEPGKLDQCAHAMDALQRSMRWDEKSSASNATSTTT
jgi:aminopeptidase N